jgi:mRNA-degrading endonuclease toxin of MazEF toxin-antitoxin module
LSQLRYGRIIWGELKDRNGFRKQRPGIVVTPTAHIETDTPLVIVCVTTSFSEPPPVGHVLLPWNSDPRRVRTRLARRSAAVVDWLETLYPDEVLSVGGDVPASLMRAIQQQLRAADEDGGQREDADAE